PHKIGLKSIVYLKKVEKYLRIGRKRKNKKVKKSGNSGFKEFPRPLFQKNGGMTYVDAQYFWREFI
ncbi:hypothetical protein, partial [Eisenbergiella porci]